MVRGLRASSDFELEFEMAMMNKQLFPGLEMVCLMASLQYQFFKFQPVKGSCPAWRSN
jgi:pantetheine-phosphate adenylyltransferase